MSIRESGIRALAAVTRKVHPRGTFHALRRLHSWERRRWAVEDIVPFEGKMRVWASTSNFVEWLAYFFGTYEPEIVDLIRRAIRPGHTAVDVGANVGYLALAMADASKGGPVLACEPNPQIYDRLMRNIELNSLPNIRPHQLALSDREGTAKLFIPNPQTQSNLSTASLSQHEEFLSDAGTVDVKMVTLDQLVREENISNVDLIKIDVEGYEAPVLAGATEVIAKYRPTLIFEYRERYWREVGFTFDDVRKQLAAVGYGEFFNITLRGLQPIGEIPDPDMNVFTAGEAFH